jgi:glycosyltransferase involved in cell wall biosynthesis
MGSIIMEKARVSACIITFCKEDLIEDCLKSVKWADEIIVVDSHSTDKTVDICRKYTDKVYQREWTGFRDQRNYTMGLANYEWILFIDSDERIPSELYKEIQLHLRDGSNKWDGFHFPRQTYYMGKWINHGEWYPSYCLRLYRKDKGHWINEPHERLELNGKAKYLKNHMLHYTYRDLSEQLETIDKYTESFSVERDKEDIKYITFQLIFRPFFRFIRGYFFRRGFLDGIPGLVAAITTSFYVFMKYAKLWESRIKKSH